MADEPRYSRDQVSLVLRRVAELSVHAPEGEDLTRAELREVVREAGLDGALVERALGELEVARRATATTAGLRVLAACRRRVRAPMSEVGLQRAVTLLNQHVGTVGEYELSTAGLSWLGRHVSVSVTAKGGELEVDVQERFSRTARTRLSLAAVGSIMAIAPGLAVLFDGIVLVGVLGIVAAPILAYGAVRLFHNRRVGATQKDIEGLADRLVQTLAVGESPSLEPGSATDESPG